MLAFSNSDDSSAQQGGDLGYFGPNQMVKPFNDFVFNNGGKVGLVETAFHIIKITDKQDGIRLATIGLKFKLLKLLPIRCLHKQLNLKAADKGFDKVVKEMGLKVAAPATIKAMDEILVL
jgi:peptidyl-prolyl cis-trans isomerase D